MKLFPALLILILLVTPTIVFAQTRAVVSKDRVEIKREQMASRAAAVRTKMAESKEVFLERRSKFASAAATRKDTLKTQLKAIKDRKKAAMAERLDANLSKINETRTTNMLKQLDQMDDLVDRVEARIATVSALATTEVASAIAESRDNIDTARAAVQEQSTVSYPVTITTEAALKTEFQEARDQLLADLKKVHTQVVDARKSVAVVFVAIAKTKEGTSGGQ